MIAIVRLLTLTGAPESRPVAVGERLELASGVFLTVRNEHGDAIVERDSERGAAVAVNDGAPVLEIAHVKPLEIIDAGGAKHTVLPAFGVFVRQDLGRAEKEKRLQDHFAIALARALPDAHAKGEVRSRGKSGKLAFVAAAGVMAISVVTLGLNHQHERKAAPSAEARPADATSVTPASTAESAPAPNPEPARIDVIAGPAVVGNVSVNDAAQVQGPAPAKGSPPPAKVLSEKPAPKAPAKDASAPATLAAPSMAKAEKPGDRRAFESYRLESGFDPEGAASKLKRLKSQIPADSALAHDVDNALKDLGP